LLVPTFARCHQGASLPVPSMGALFQVWGYEDLARNIFEHVDILCIWTAIKSCFLGVFGVVVFKNFFSVLQKSHKWLWRHAVELKLPI